MRLAILRAASFPTSFKWLSSNINEFFAEDDLLIECFNAQGCRASGVVWSDPTVDWNQFDAAIIRSTWDYLDDPEYFLSVLQTIENSSCRLFNDRTTISWNINKRYLLDLAGKGIPVVPTEIISGGICAGLKSHSAMGSRTLVLKPLIGLGADRVIRIGIEDLDSKLIEISTDHPDQENLLQPFVESVTTEGELSFIYFNSRFSHAVVKQPKPGDFRSQSHYGASIRLIEPSKIDLDQANMVMEKLHPMTPLYARVDMVRIDGLLHVMELELIEPFLFFSQFPDRVAGLVRAMQERLISAQG